MTKVDFLDAIITSADDNEVKAVYAGGLNVRHDNLVRKFLWAREAAIYGLAEAMQEVINAYKNGVGTEPSARMAFEWLKKAAGEKQEWAYFDLAIMYRDGEGTGLDITKFREWMEKAAAVQGGREAMRTLAESYKRPKYGEPDYAMFLHWTRRMAKADGAVAMIDLSRLYATGSHVPYDVGLQLEWADKAVNAARLAFANKNEPDGALEDLPLALKALADAYYANGRFPEATKNFKAAAEASYRVYTTATNEYFDISEDLLQIVLQYQKTLKKNTKEGFHWLKITAELVEARYANLGDCLPEFGEAVRLLAEAYRNGYGTSRDQKLSVSALEIAKQVRNPEAMYQLARADSPTYLVDLREAANAGSDEAFDLIHVMDCDLPACEAERMHSAVTQLRAAVYQYRDKFHSVNESDAPSGIAHYTGNAALEGMLSPALSESKNLMRMYNFAYFNDPGEGRRLYLVDGTNENPLSKFGQPTTYKEDVRTESQFVYIGSLSLVPDQLDLWRAYTDNGKGFSIVTPFSAFSKNLTRSLMATWNNERRPSTIPTLYKVLYEQKEAERALKTLSPKLKVIEDAIGKFSPEKKEKIRQLVRMIANELLFLYKSEDYRSEKEVRFVKALGLNMSEVRRDESRSPIRLYMETQPFFFNTPKSKIIIGPTVDNQTSVAMALRHALVSRGWDGACEISYSTVNYQIASSARR
jgi:TPR repeat protein